MAVSVAALVRLPNLFTAPPDVVLGAAIAAAAGASIAPVTVAGLALSSMLLYAGGTALNDAFDAPDDAIERPERPIPSGDLARRTGFALGSLFLLGGTVVAAIVAGVRGGGVAAATATGILLYDGALKGGGAGFITMGAVRGLNVLLGTTAGTGPGQFRWFLPPVAVAAYVGSVTFMAEAETGNGGRSRVLAASLGTAIAAMAIIAYHMVTGPALVTAGTGLFLTGAFLVWTLSALGPAYLEPVPERIGPAVGTCVLAIVVLDAAFAAAAGWTWAVTAASFLVPAVGLSGPFEVT